MSSNNTTITVRKRVKTIPDRVFGALTDPLRAKKFMFVTETGKMVHVEIDPQVGGKYVFVEERDGEEVEHAGEFTKIERPNLLEFKMMVEKYSEHPSLVRIEIESLGHWSEIVVTHEMHSDFEDDKALMLSGWEEILKKLAALLE